MLAEYKRLESQIHSLQTQLSAYPSGKLNYVHNGAYCKWFLSDGHRQTYISKKERPFAEKLAAKKFGLMDDPLYCKNAASKLQLYTSHGLIPSIQLITTYETREHPLSPKLVEEIVRHYFL